MNSNLSLHADDGDRGDDIDQSPLQEGTPSDPALKVKTSDDVSLRYAPGLDYDSRLAALRLAIEEQRNPFAEAARLLLRTLAELPRTLDERGVRALHTLLTQELESRRRCGTARWRRTRAGPAARTGCVPRATPTAWSAPCRASSASP